MRYSQQHTTDLTGRGSLCRHPSFAPNDLTSQANNDDELIILYSINNLALLHDKKDGINLYTIIY
ncbi:hypothetical protein DPMN_103306 [Dreissena polymorpha]|uniref:Uncharacterized protein n=1 Tax=Dreissena polymorpha TaxID=45954 RepID=A0A9D4HAW6_DREPO|nr:hypothetical protein DPMN_103306 [Dreissena polymorpha]